VATTPETVEHRARSWREVSLSPRIGVPRALRLRFVAPAAMGFASFALGGFYSALAPGFLSKQMHQSDVAVVVRGGRALLRRGVGDRGRGAAWKPRGALRAAVGFLSRPSEC
jgi:hypothetical protein